MTISYLLAPMPKWYIADLVGRPLGGGSMFTYRSLDKTQQKFVFQDPQGNFPWTDPILFDENGSQGPFYWAVDSLDPDETYYIEVYDSKGVLQWTIDQFLPPGSGGGGSTTLGLNIQNLISNNLMWRNLGTTPVSTSTALLVAPGAHAALANNVANSAGTYTGPDIYFIKNNTSATDTIAFPIFTTGVTPLTGDVTPVDYLEYKCSIAGSAETTKCVQFPITEQVQNLSNQNVMVTLWGQGSGSDTTITLNWYQFFGDGGSPTAPVKTPIQSITLTASWKKTVISTIVPDISANVPLILGSCGNSALFLQVEMPHNATCTIDICKPCVYLGNIAPAEDYTTYDAIEAQINSPRTGDLKIGFANSTLPGYVPMNDGTIGSASSGASTRANIDTFALYALLWNNVLDTWAPVSTGRGASAVADFVANKTLTLTRTLGRSLSTAGAGAGLTSRALGEFVGAESSNNVPSHTHTATIVGGGDPATDGGGAHFVTLLGKNAGIPAASFGAVTVNANAGAAATPTITPSAFTNVFIKL